MWGFDMNKNENRRRLLKSMSAVPIIYTLPNGAAFANSSSTCYTDSTVSVTSSDGSDQLTDSNGMVYTKSGNQYVDEMGMLYNFDGHQTLAFASCWASIGPVNSDRYW